MGSSKVHLTQIGLVLNLLTGSISTQYHVLFDDMLSTLVVITDTDPEPWISLVIASN